MKRMGFNDAEAAMVGRAVLALIVIAGSFASVFLLAQTGLTSQTFVVAALTGIAVILGVLVAVRDGD